MSINPAPLDTPEPAITTEIAEYRPIAAALHQLRQRHQGVVHDCSTPDGMQAARAARGEVRKHRTGLEAVRQQVKAQPLDLCRRIDLEAKAITDALVALEAPLDLQIKREEEDQEARREAKRQREQAQQAAYRRMVDTIASWPLSCLGEPAEVIRGAIARYEKHETPPDIPPLYHAEATAAKERALDKLREMLATSVEWEAEQARLAAEDNRLREEHQRVESLRQQAIRETAAERERWAKEQAAERAEAERRSAEERAELDRQRVEHARIERELVEERARIAAERAIPEERGLDPYKPKLNDPEAQGPREPAAEVRFQDGVLTEVDRAPAGFQAEVEPVASDAVVLRDLAHVLERGGEPYGWIPNRLRTIAARLEAMDAAEFVEEASEWP